MKNLPCCVMAISALLFACSNSSDNAAAGAAKGGSSAGGKTSSAAGSGGSSTTASSGGTTSVASAGTTSTLSPDTSGLDGTAIVTQLGPTDTATLCQWIEVVIGLTRGATSDVLYTGIWYDNQCPSNVPVQLWGSPDLCAIGVSTGNTVGCQTLTVASFESCIKAVKTDLCLLETAPACAPFNLCFPQVVED